MKIDLINNSGNGCTTNHEQKRQIIIPSIRNPNMVRLIKATFQAQDMLTHSKQNLDIYKEISMQIGDCMLQSRNLI